MACIRKRRGQWVTDYRDGGGVRRWRTFATKRDVEDFLAKTIPEVRQRKRAVVPVTITATVYADRWLRLIASTVKPRTLESYASTLRLHLLPVFGAWRVQHLDKGGIKAMLADKLASGLSRNTVRIIHATLRAMLRAAVDDGIMPVNPAEKLGRQLHLVTPKAVRQEEIKAMTREQRQRFLTTAARETPHYYPLLFTLAGTGIRLGEALALQWGDIDGFAREIRITRSLSRGEVGTPKAGHGRTVDLSEVLAETLWQLEQTCTREALLMGCPTLPPWVFCTRAGTPMDESKVRRAMRHVLQKATLPLHFSPHCLRHTYASLMLQQGESLTYVQRQLGHASINLTADTYGKCLPLGNKAAVDRLDAPLVPQSGSKRCLGRSKECRSGGKFGGPCRGRTYGPLIKSGNRAIIRTA